MKIGSKTRPSGCVVLRVIFRFVRPLAFVAVRAPNLSLANQPIADAVTVIFRFSRSGVSKRLLSLLPSPLVGAPRASCERCAGRGAGWARALSLATPTYARGEGFLLERRRDWKRDCSGGTYHIPGAFFPGSNHFGTAATFLTTKRLEIVWDKFCSWIILLPNRKRSRAARWAQILPKRAARFHPAS